MPNKFGERVRDSLLGVQLADCTTERQVRFDFVKNAEIEDLRITVSSPFSADEPIVAHIYEDEAVLLARGIIAQVEGEDTEVADLEACIKDLERKLESAEADANDYQDRYDRAERHNFDLEGEIERLRAELDSSDSRADDRVQLQAAHYQAKIDELKRQLAEFATEPPVRLAVPQEHCAW